MGWLCHSEAKPKNLERDPSGTITSVLRMTYLTLFVILRPHFCHSEAKLKNLNLMEKAYWVYILTNKYNAVFYVGVTRDLIKRIWQHKEKLVVGFTQKYNLTKLVYYEKFTDILGAIQREKYIKGKRRKL